MPDRDVADPRYSEGYFLRGEGSNYHDYADDRGWALTAATLRVLEPKANPTLLEVGCATGWFIRAARRQGFLARGVDVSQWAVDNPAPDVETLTELGEAQSLRFPEDSFDVVCSWEVLEHIDADEIPASIEGMTNVLRPGGLMIHRICLPGLEDDDHTHVSVFERAWWLPQFERVGLRRLEYVEKMFDQQFVARDWAGRFFAYRKPL